MLVALAPDEVVRILGFLEGEHRLFSQLLYGTGMRISEGLQLRAKDLDLDFDHGTIIVREGTRIGFDVEPYKEMCFLWAYLQHRPIQFGTGKALFVFNSKIYICPLCLYCGTVRNYN